MKEGVVCFITLPERIVLQFPLHRTSFKCYFEKKPR